MNRLLFIFAFDTFKFLLFYLNVSFKLLKKTLAHDYVTLNRGMVESLVRERKGNYGIIRLRIVWDGCRMPMAIHKLQL